MHPVLKPILHFCITTHCSEHDLQEIEVYPSSE